ncbi:hypothetical protein NQ318_010775 [Aromia moschata]|uniref:Uncharacterized protein n=1 Tax=Aromia moschata TaxID=1265417 RepID=A0AAV8YXB2_9CUCU|nr:hypothetical protein NQ318_010775 [Aromia moschata]
MEVNLEKLDLFAIRRRVDQDCSMRPLRLRFLVKLLWLPLRHFLKLHNKLDCQDCQESIEASQISPIQTTNYIRIRG